MDLDYAREQFTFDVISLASYVLGQAQHGSISQLMNASDESSANETAENSPVLVGSGNGSTIEIDVLQVNICHFYANKAI